MNRPLKIFFLCFSIVLLLVGCVEKKEQSTVQEINSQERPPIIDMHMHTNQWNRYGDPPPPNQVSGVVPTARTDEEAVEAYLADMERYNIVLAVGSIEIENLDLLNKWIAASSGRILGGIQFPEYSIPESPTPVIKWPDLNLIRAEYESGDLAVMGEITAQYAGIAANNPRVEPYFALAEELDIPVCFHCGTGPPGAPYRTALRAALGNPLLLEDVLVRHPKLRIYLAHAGHPFLAETKAIMHLYPKVYADISVLNWALPREAFYDYLRPLIRFGLGKRLMYGSDQQIWPDAVGMSIESIESADFLTEEQKRDIFYNNAVRFLRLEEEVQ